MFFLRNYLAGALLLVLTPVSLFAESEQIMVDKEEYEALKKAVQFLMEEREQTQAKIQAAEDTAQKAAVAAEQASSKSEEASQVAEAAAEASESPLLDSLQNISIGGYGEVHYNNLNADDSANDVDEIDLHRFVLFFGYQFAENFRFYSEFEIEHGGVDSDGDPLQGEVEVEQAFVEYDFNEHSSLLGGVFLLPVGLLNETHEPDTFYGVERNSVESIIIPATWWEAGVKYTYRFDQGLKFEVAVHSGLEIDPTGEAQVRGGRQKASEADASHFAYTTAVTYTGISGLELGVAAQLQDDASQSGGDGLDDGFLWETHLAYNQGIFGLRALYAHWDFDGDVVEAANDDKQHGWYIEPSIRPWDQLGFFARYEDVRGGRERDEFDEWRIGFNYWPHEQVVVKFDYQDRNHDEDSEEGRDFDGYNLGIGWSF